MSNCTTTYHNKGSVFVPYLLVVVLEVAGVAVSSRDIVWHFIQKSILRNVPTHSGIRVPKSLLH